MPPRNDAPPPSFDASCGAKEPLIATGDAEEKDQGQEERALSSFIMLSFLLLGLILGFCFQATAIGAKTLAMMVGSKYFLESNISLVVFSILLSLFTGITLLLFWYSPQLGAMPRCRTLVTRRHDLALTAILAWVLWLV
jgi:hypothetical protein